MVNKSKKSGLIKKDHKTHLYTTKYKQEMCQTVLDMMIEGKSVKQVCGALGITPATFHAWSRDTRKLEFGKAVEKGKIASEAYWEELGRLGVQGKLDKFNASAYIYMMKCKFKGDWLEDGRHDKLEVTNKYESMSDQDLTRAIKSILKKSDLFLETKPINVINLPIEQVKVQDE